MLEDDEEPDLGVLGGLDDALPAGGLARVADGVAHRALVGEGALLGREPARRQGLVGQDEEGQERDDEGDGALEDEEPAPARDAGLGGSVEDQRLDILPLTMPSILKMPSAIRPANAVARMLPVYRIEILVASSLRV